MWEQRKVEKRRRGEKARMEGRKGREKEKEAVHPVVLKVGAHVTQHCQTDRIVLLLGSASHPRAYLGGDRRYAPNGEMATNFYQIYIILVHW